MNLLIDAGYRRRLILYRCLYSVSLSQWSASSPMAYPIYKHYLIDRLGHIIVHTCLSAFLCTVQRSLGGHCNDRRMHIVLLFPDSNLSGCFHSIHHWHHNIHQNRIKRSRICSFHLIDCFRPFHACITVAPFSSR